MTDDKPASRLPLAALPWPAAAFGAGGVISATNHAFLLSFPGAGKPGATIDDLFEPSPSGESASRELPRLVDEDGSWQGLRRAKPGAADERFRVMVSRDPENPGAHWIFLPENPVVRNRPQLTPRSEFELTRMLLDHTPDFVFLRDPAGVIIFASRALTRFLRTPSEGYETGRPITNFLSAECASEFARMDAETLGAGATVNLSRFTFETPSGARVVLDLTQEPVRNSAGNLVALLTFGRDITSRIARENKLHLALEDARAAGEAKAFFVANISHEIRTPLNGVIGMTELCLETPLNAEQRKYLRTALDCGRTLLTLMNDILDFSKVDAGRMTLEHIDFDLASIVADTAAHFAHRAHANKVELVLDTDPALPARVKGDPMRLRQIVANLISNAVKFTAEGTVLVRLRAGAKSGRRATVRIDISDTGIGIPSEKQSAIFEAFVQADSTTTRRFGGTGLGLSICKRLIDIMGGTLTVSSTPGVGSVFSAEFSFETAGEDDIAGDAPIEDIRVAVCGGDCPQTQALTRLFRGLGARVLEAEEPPSPALAAGADPVRLMVADYPVAGPLAHEKFDEAVLAFARAGVPVITLGGLRHEPPIVARLDGLPHLHMTKPAGANEIRSASLGLLGMTSNEEPLPGNEQGRAAQRSLRVLLAEDNPVNLKLAIRRLEKLGHRVSAAADGGEALRLFNAYRHDIIFLDVQMPVIDGYSLARIMRDKEREDGDKHTPLVAFTALATPSDRAACLDAGFDMILVKPFLAADLNRTIEKLVLENDSRGDSPDSRTEASPDSDFDFAAVLRRMDSVDAEDMIFAGRVFLDYQGAEIEELRRARLAGDLRALALVAHRVKSGLASLHSTAAADCAAALEQAATSDKSEASDALAGRLLPLIESTAAAIRRATEG